MQDPPDSAAESFANGDVLEFYRTLPFNFRETAEASAKAIRADDQVRNYPVLLPLLKKRMRLLDVGCGAGWFGNSAAQHHPVAVTGIDFNPVAVARAQEVAAVLSLKSRFEVADLFAYRPQPAFDLVVSLGVLHHTNDCHAAIRHVFRHCVKPGGHVFIGLYHRFGRQPFLDHFEQLKHRGDSEQQLFERYAELHQNIGDPTHLRSWFRDQVLHPHETQHTLEELMPLLDDNGMTLVSTSINRFAPIESLPQLYAQESSYHDLGVQRLRENRYFPGFFVFLARKSA